MSTKTLASGPKLIDPKSKCDKFQKQAAAASAAGAVIGVFTYGIGTVAGIAAAAALTKKGQDCVRKVAIQNAALQKKYDEQTNASESRTSGSLQDIKSSFGIERISGVRIRTPDDINSTMETIIWWRNIAWVIGGLTITYYIFKK